MQANRGKVLITGIFGQDAAYLAAMALKANYQVIGAGRGLGEAHKYWRLDQLGLRHRITLCELDMTQTSQVCALVGQYRPELIFNLAAQSSVAMSLNHPFETLDVTLMGMVRLLEAVRTQSASSRVFQPASAEESMDPAAWRSAYAAARSCATGLAKYYRQVHGLYVSTAIMHNHESPLRDDRFVSKKIIQTLCRIAQGSDEVLMLGNLESMRDWSHARDFMTAAWLSLDQELPGDDEFSSGQVLSVRSFVELAAQALNIALRWEGSGINERGVRATDGKVLVAVDSAFYRPTDPPPKRGVDPLTQQRLGWQAQTTVEGMIAEMIKFEHLKSFK